MKMCTHVAPTIEAAKARPGAVYIEVRAFPTPDCIAKDFNGSGAACLLRAEPAFGSCSGTVSCGSSSGLAGSYGSVGQGDLEFAVG